MKDKKKIEKFTLSTEWLKHKEMRKIFDIWNDTQDNVDKRCLKPYVIKIITTPDKRLE